jgi:acylphosphatase
MGATNRNFERRTTGQFDSYFRIKENGQVVVGVNGETERLVTLFDNAITKDKRFQEITSKYNVRTIRNLVSLKKGKKAD